MYSKKDITLAYLGTVLAANFPILFLWLNNIIQISDILSVLKIIGQITAVTTALIVLFFFLYKRNIHIAALAAMLTMLFLENGRYMEALLALIIKDWRYWHNITIIVVVLIALLFAMRKMKPDTAKTFTKIFSLVFTALTLFNLVMAIPSIISKASASGQKNALTSQAVNDDSRRNVYWLLFDDYAPNVAMQEYYNFDNSPFTDWLEEKGFSVSYTSKNETNITAVITSNIANLGYVSSYSNERTLTEDYALILESRKNTKLMQVIQENQYGMIGIGNAEFYGYTGPLSGAANGDATLDGSTLESLFLRNTVLYPFANSDYNEAADAMLSQLTFLQDPENLPSGGTFVLAHYVCPHTPYLFFADGTEATPNAPSNYLEYFQFATSQMKAIVSNILENDSSAMIAVMSDHGNKGKGVYEQNLRCFAALYNGGGDPIDIEGYSAVNVMVEILNEVFSTDYPLVPYQMLEQVDH